jgi:hypothetical protein
MISEPTENASEPKPDRRKPPFHFALARQRGWRPETSVPQAMRANTPAMMNILVDPTCASGFMAANMACAVG